MEYLNEVDQFLTSLENGTFFQQTTTTTTTTEGKTSVKRVARCHTKQNSYIAPQYRRISERKNRYK